MSIWPFETYFAAKIEVFNECTNILLLYGLMMFTDFVPDAQMRFNLGFCYIGVTLSNILLHLTVLIAGSLALLRKTIRKALYKRRVAQYMA